MDAKKVDARWTREERAALAAVPDHGQRIEFICEVLGPRACGGFFNPTLDNVRVKFLGAWGIANSIERGEQ